MITVTAFFPLGAGWYLAWTSDIPGAVFRIYRDGILIDTTAVSHATIPIDPDTSPVLEILDDPDAMPTRVYPPYLVLTWLSVPGTDHYEIDQFVASAWMKTKEIPDDGSPVFSWRSPPLPDGQVATFRVIPFGVNGNAGTPLTFVKLVVRIPDAPNVTMTYNAGTGEVTIAAA